MAISKEDNAAMLDPNRFKIAKQMAYMPGGPMNNNPMNVTSLNETPGSASGVNEYPYGDSGMVDARQMGSNAVMPMQPSGLPQNMTMMKGLNKGQPYGAQEQPPARMEEQLEGMRYSADTESRGLVTNPYMGLSGLPAQVAPGGVVPSGQQSDATIPLMAQTTESIPPVKGKGMNMRNGKRG